MAKLRGNLFGNFQGKIGLTYGRMVHGVNLGANMPVKRDNNKATQEQWDYQKRFAQLAQMASAFLAAIKIGLKTAAKNIGPLVSEFDAFVRINKNNVTIEGASMEIGYETMVLAKGHLPVVGFGAPDFETPLTVSVDFTPNADAPGATADDDVYVVAYEPISMMAVTSAPVKRSTGSADLRLPSVWSGLTVYVYGFAVGAGTTNTGVVSNSAYIGTGNVG